MLFRSTKPKVSRRKEIIEIRGEINEIETKKTIAKINKTKNWFFEKISKIDKALARLIKKKRGPKSVTSVIKKEKLQMIPQAYRGPQEITMSNYTPIKWSTYKKLTNF